jgi:hypothetical protein
MGYIAEGIRFYRIAKFHCDSTDQNSHDALVSVVFAAMYFESVLNEVIFSDKLWAESYRKAGIEPDGEIDIDIYQEMESTLKKIELICKRYDIADFTL